MRVLHLPTPTGGNAWGLSQAERKLGLDSKVLYASTDWLNYPADEIVSTSKNRLEIFIKRGLKAWEVHNRYDVFHFNFGSTLLDFMERNLNYLDLPLYRGKKCFVTYNGCDARQKYKRMKQTEICSCKYPECYSGICMDESWERRKEKRIAKLTKAGFGMFAITPDLMNFLPENTVFLPCTIANWDDVPVEKPRCQSGKEPLRVVHAPTDRAGKGTDAVIREIAKLREKYPGKIELVLIEKIPHEEALKIYMSADLVIDQLRNGWYGAFAVEVMKRGKPVIAYINEEDLHFIPEKMQKDVCESIINANEYNLYEVLEQILLDRPRLLHYIEAQQNYIYQWHDPIKVAQMVKGLYES